MPLIRCENVTCSWYDQFSQNNYTDVSPTCVLLAPVGVLGRLQRMAIRFAVFLLYTTVSGVNLSRRIGFNVASGAPCDILLNCTVEIFVLN